MRCTASSARRNACWGCALCARNLPEAQAADQVLAVDLRDRDPDAAFTEVPARKAGCSSRYLDAKFGRERFDAFLRGYFDHFAFKSITTEQFLAYLKENLLDRFPGIVSRDQVMAWVMGPGIPADAVCRRRAPSSRWTQARSAWLAGKLPPRSSILDLAHAAVAVLSRQHAGGAAQGSARRSRSGVRLYAQPRMRNRAQLAHAGDPQRLPAGLFRASRNI
jgi:hypothetical protein